MDTANPSLTRALSSATLIGTVMQLAMVVCGHFVPAVAKSFGVAGITISLLAGLLYAIWGRHAARGTAASGGALAGGICAVIGIAVSYVLGDVPAGILVFGTLSSAITGALGGVIGSALIPRSAVQA